jgi:TFIIF-interacting CTD phosphatase-like protein
MKETVLVENNLVGCSLQIDNAIPISDFYQDQSDKELNYLESYLLKHIYDKEDVRVVNRLHF